MTFKCAVPRVGLLAILSFLLWLLLGGPALGAETGVAGESDGGFDFDTVEQVLADVLIPLGTLSVGFVAGKRKERKKQERAYRDQQLAAIDDFMAASDGVRRRLSSYAMDAASSADVGGLRDDLMRLQAPRLIDDQELEEKARVFYGRSLDVLRATVTSRSSQPIAEAALAAHLDMSARAAQVKRELTPPPRKRGERDAEKGAAAQTVAVAPARVEQDAPANKKPLP